MLRRSVTLRVFADEQPWNRVGTFIAQRHILALAKQFAQRDTKQSMLSLQAWKKWRMSSTDEIPPLLSDDKIDELVFSDRARIFCGYMGETLLAEQPKSIALRQLTDLLNAVREADIEVSQASDVQLPGPRSCRSFTQNPSAQRAHLRDVYHRVFAKVGYCPYVKESSIPNAGRGLFVKGDVPAGAMLGMIPGIVYNMSDRLRMGLPYADTSGNINYNLFHFARGFQVDGDVARYARLAQRVNQEVPDDDVVAHHNNLSAYSHRSVFERVFGTRAINLQAEWGAISRRAPYEPLAASAAQLLALRANHPFSQLHMVNSSPQNIPPNAVRCLLPVPFTFPATLLPYIASIPSTSPAALDISSNPVVPHSESRLDSWAALEEVNVSLVTEVVALPTLLASRNISDGEEIVIDYRINPRSAYRPDWYFPHDARLIGSINGKDVVGFDDHLRDVAGRAAARAAPVDQSLETLYGKYTDTPQTADANDAAGAPAGAGYSAMSPKSSSRSPR